MMGFALLKTAAARGPLAKPLLSPESEQSTADTQEVSSQACESPSQLRETSTQTSCDASQLASSHTREEIWPPNEIEQSTTGADCCCCGNFCDLPKSDCAPGPEGYLGPMMCCLCRRQRECHNTMAGDQDDDCMACSERDLFNLLGYDLEDNVPCTYSLASAGAASAGAASVGAASAGAASAGEVSLRPRSLLNPPITDQGTSTDQNAMGGDDRMALGRGKDTPSGSLDIIVELVKERREGRISHREFQDAKRQVLESMEKAQTSDDSEESAICCSCFSCG